ncbi:MAG TPA: VWA domain-containing protein [Enhygromyxa sp.]|nr:VWA domain-containing protein [Enhygromyxa sp.]
MRKIALKSFVCLSTLVLLHACASEEDAADEAASNGDGDPGGDGGDGDGDRPDDTGDGDGDGDGDPEPMCNDADDVVLYLSPDDSNSMSSPVQVRTRVLEDGSTSLSATPIRVWEFMNYYDFPYPAAEDGQLALHAAIQPIDGDPTTWRLQLAVSSEAQAPEERPPMNVTLVLDTSGSMAGAPIELLKETSRAIAAQLRAGDTVSVCEWDTQNVWSLGGYQVSGPNDPMLLQVINAVEAGGGTDLNGGLVSGYQLAQQVFDIEKVNRLVLISDGGANAGVTEIELIAQNAMYGGSDGIYLVGVGVGDEGSYNDDLMNDVTDAGKGASIFIPSNDEAWKVFGDDFENTMAIAGRDVQVELTMPPGFEIVKFSGEEFSENPDEVEPQHIAPNDAMVFHQQVQTCAPELVDDNAEITVTASWEDPWTFESKQVTQTWTWAELSAGDQGLLLKGAATLAYAEALHAYRKAVTGDDKQLALVPAIEAVAAAQEALPQDADLGEMAQILAALEI